MTSEKVRSYYAAIEARKAAYRAALAAGVDPEQAQIDYLLSGGRSEQRRGQELAARRAERLAAPVVDSQKAMRLLREQIALLAQRLEEDDLPLDDGGNTAAEYHALRAELARREMASC